VKGEALARAAGRARGEVVAVSEVTGRGPVVPLRKAMVVAESAGPPLQAGELEVAAEVEVEFALR
jgi:uncharacterized protein YggE